MFLREFFVMLLKKKVPFRRKNEKEMVASTRIFAIVSRPLEVLHVPSGE
jgi:hypothetical protein